MFGLGTLCLYILLLFVMLFLVGAEKIYDSIKVAKRKRELEEARKKQEIIQRNSELVQATRREEEIRIWKMKLKAAEASKEDVCLKCKTIKPDRCGSCGKCIKCAGIGDTKSECYICQNKRKERIVREAAARGVDICPNCLTENPGRCSRCGCCFNCYGSCGSLCSSCDYDDNNDD